MLMKKCAVLKDMEINKNDPKWITQRIRNRFEATKRPIFGLCKQFGPETTMFYLESENKVR